MSVYKEIPKFNFKDVIYKNGEEDPETGEIEPIEASVERYLFYRINKKQDLAGIVIPLYEDVIDPETGQVIATKPALQDKTATPSTDTQVITPDLEDGYLGLGSVTINPIDVIGTVNITPEENPQIITVNGYVSTIEVDGVDYHIDNDIKEQNIRHDVNILGIVGKYDGDDPINPVVNGTTLIMYEAADISEEDPHTLDVHTTPQP